MTDYRVSDLPYGQVGDCTYDVEQQSWTFARQLSYNYGIQPVDLPRQCLPSTLPHDSSTPAPSRQVQKTVLTKRFPELLPATFITTELERGAPNEVISLSEALSTSSSLVGFGQAKDLENRRAAGIDILAVASGKAGEVLRLIRPQIDKLGWPGHGNIHIEVTDPGTAIDECYWASNGGPICQVSFAAEKDLQSNWLSSSSTWLAVRQLSSTTVFRPLYRRELVSAILPNGSALRYPPSRLTSNPLATIHLDETGGLPHADVSFNPYYVRQIAIIDQGGSWSVWDMEGQYRKSTFKFERSKKGHINDDCDPEARSDPPDVADGWGRILWAGDVNTLIVCGRCHFAVFNIQAEPIRIRTPDFFTSMSSGWILDVKQNVRQLNHVFVLTSARLFWLEIVPDDGQIIILYSCRHFRDEGGENMKLEILSEESSCTLFLYSAVNALINTYRFSTVRNRNGMPESTNSSFVCKDIAEAKMPSNKMHSIIISRSQYAGKGVERGDGTGPGSKYLESDIVFYQLFTLDIDLGLRVTLCSTTLPLERHSTTDSMKFKPISAPSVKEVKNTARQSRQTTGADPFIALDDFEDDSDFERSNKQYVRLQVHGGHIRQGRSQRRPYAVEYERIDFEKTFPRASLPAIVGEESSESQSQDAIEFMRSIPQLIETWKEEEPSLTTLLELTKSLSFSGDIDDAAGAFEDIVSSLPEETENEAEKVLTLSPLGGTDSSLLTGRVREYHTFPDLIAIYNHLIDIWVTSLPRRTPGATRLMKERIIRRVATELALSSVAISMRTPQVQKPEDLLETDAMALDHGTPFSSSQLAPAAESSQGRARSRSISMDPGLLTPAYTPSLTSEGSTYSERAEDPALAMLRMTADFRTQQPSGATLSRIMPHWIPGSDPNQYSWEATQQANTVTEDEDDDHASARRAKRKRDKAKRNRRAATSESASQPLPTSYSQPPLILPQSRHPPAFGSQPAFAPNVASSQVRDITMTQVEEGQYGGRQSHKKGKRKKRKQGF